MIFLSTILLGLLAAYREVQILIDRKSWNAEMFWIPFWYYDWRKWYKNFDSFHFIEGARALVMFYMVVTFAYQWYWLPVLWVGYYYVRCTGMHILFRKSGYRQYGYLWFNIDVIFSKRKF